MSCVLTVLHITLQNTISPHRSLSLSLHDVSFFSPTIFPPSSLPHSFSPIFSSSFLLSSLVLLALWSALTSFSSFHLLVMLSIWLELFYTEFSILWLWGHFLSACFIPISSSFLLYSLFLFFFSPKKVILFLKLTLCLLFISDFLFFFLPYPLWSFSDSYYCSLSSYSTLFLYFCLYLYHSNPTPVLSYDTIPYYTNNIAMSLVYSKSWYTLWHLISERLMYFSQAVTETLET